MSENPQENNDAEDQFRMDFVQESGSVKKEDGYYKIKGVLKPDPERYEYIDEDGKKGWLDTLDNVFFLEDVFAEGVERMETPQFTIALLKSMILLTISKVESQG